MNQKEKDDFWEHARKCSDIVDSWPEWKKNVFRKKENKMTLRPVLRDFVYEMEATLKHNDHKRGWDKESLEWLMVKLMEEVGELAVLVRDSNIHISPVKFTREATDVANVAMMIADRAKQILEKEPYNE